MTKQSHRASTLNPEEPKNLGAKMEWIVAIVAIVVGCSTLLKLANAISKRGAGKQELQELRDSIAQLQTDVEEIKATLADIVISLDRYKIP